MHQEKPSKHALQELLEKNDLKMLQQRRLDLHGPAMVEDVLPKEEMRQECVQVGLKLGRTRGDDLILRLGMLVVGEGQNRGEIGGGVVDDQFATQLTIQSAKTSGHEGREIALDDPLLEGNRSGCCFNYVEKTRPGKVANLAIVVNVIDEEVEQGEVLLLRSTSKSLAAVQLQLLPLLRPVRLRLEPGRQDIGIESDLGGDIESELHDAGFGVGAQTDAVRACDTDEQVRQTGRKGVVLHKGLLLALDQRGEEQDGLLDDPFAKRASRYLGYWNVDLFRGGEGDAWVRQWTAGFIAEEARELLESNLDLFGSLVVVGQVRGVAPCLLRRDG